MALDTSVATRARTMHDQSECPFWPGVDSVHSSSLPTNGVGWSRWADTAQLDDHSQVESFAVITVRNDTRCPVEFDLRVLPNFRRAQSFALNPGCQRAFFSVYRRWIGQLHFQVDFLSIHGPAQTRRTHRLTVFNVLQTRPDGRINHGDGRLYVFRPTAAGCDLFLA